MRRIAGWAVAACCISTLANAGAPELTAAQIVEKNAAARGGLEAWRRIQTMVWVGHVESADAPASRRSFILEQKRPNKTRFEITADTTDELAFANAAQVIDGPLMDYAAKGVVVTLDGVDEVEGRKAYRLNVRLPSGLRQVVWIDAGTFLDIKYDRVSR